MNCTFQVSSEALNIHAMTERPLEICPNGRNFDLYSKVISDMTLTAFLCFCSINKYAVEALINMQALYFHIFAKWHCFSFIDSLSTVVVFDLSISCIVVGLLKLC